jgi:hypothetical protein
VRDHGCQVFDVLSHRKGKIGAQALPGLQHMERVCQRSSEKPGTSWRARSAVEYYD